MIRLWCMFPACYKHAKKLIFQGGKSVATMGNQLTVDKQVGKNFCPPVYVLN